MNKKINNIIRIPTSLSSTFFKYWFMFLEPIHKLTNREVEIVACFLKHRYELSKVIKDNNLVDSILMSRDTKKKIMEECNLKPAFFYMTISKLKKNKVIIDDKINPKFIPNIEENSGNFKLMILFDFK